MSFTDKLFKFALLLFTTRPAILNTRSLAALVPISQSVFLARSLRAGNSNLCSCPPLKNISTPLHHKLSAALKFLLMSLSHVLDQHSVTCTKISYPTPIKTVVVNKKHVGGKRRGTQILLIFCPNYFPTFRELVNVSTCDHPITRTMQVFTFH